MKTLEEAYQLFGNYALSFIENRAWDYVVCKFNIYENLVSGEQWLYNDGYRDNKGGFQEDPNAIWGAMDAALFLRQHILDLTGDRIWGLTFTLYPNGKFKIEYDYEKPEDYEVSDDLVTGDEINESLNNLQK